MTSYSCVFIAISCLVSALSGNFITDETALLATLRTGYNVDIRPENYTEISTTIILFAVNSVDIGKEEMSISGVLINMWYDSRLRWNPMTTGIQSMVVPTKYVWTPPLIIENEIDSNKLVGTDGAPLRLLPNGYVLWTPTLSTTTSCSADITYYPYDKQTCSITIIAWTYSTNEVNLVTDPDDPVDTSYFSQNGEWELQSTGYSIFNLTKEGNTFQKLYFTFTFRRKWQFYGLNVILPIILNSILMGMVFAVPVESGEKMGYCLTVLLSFIVLLTLVSEKMPSLSDQASVIQIYLSVVMSLGTAGTLCTIVVLKLFHQDPEKPVPQWLLTFVTCCLAPLTCQCCNCCSSRRVTPKRCSQFRGMEGKTYEHQHTYQSIARMLDRFLFWVFSILISSLTFAFVASLNVQYQN